MRTTLSVFALAILTASTAYAGGETQDGLNDKLRWQLPSGLDRNMSRHELMTIIDKHPEYLASYPELERFILVERNPFLSHNRQNGTISRFERSLALEQLDRLLQSVRGYSSNL